MKRFLQIAALVLFVLANLFVAANIIAGRPVSQWLHVGFEGGSINNPNNE